MPTLKVEELHKKAEDLLTEARSKIDSIEDGMATDKVQALEQEHDGLMEQYDGIKAQITRYERIEQEERERQAAEEARGRENPNNGNPNDPRDPENRDDAPTDAERYERRVLLNRKFILNERLTDEEEVQCKRRWPEERAFWQYVCYGREALEDKARRLLVPSKVIEQRDFPADAAAGGGVVGTNTAGGYLAPEHFMMEIIKTMKDYAGILAAGVARTLTTGHGREIEFTTLDDTSNEGAPIAEATATDFTKLTWNQTTAKANKYTTKAFPVSNELLQDSVFDIESEIRTAAAERFGRRLEKDFWKGDSSTTTGEIDGMLTELSKVGARQLTMDKDNFVKVNLGDLIVDMTHLIDRAYRMNLRIMLNDDLIKAARKIKDADNRYIWQRGMDGGYPDTLMDLPYFTNAHMDGVPSKAGQYPLLIANFQKYLVRYVRDLSIRRLDELGALSDQTLFVGFGRFEGKVLDNKAFALAKSS